MKKLSAILLFLMLVLDVSICYASEPPFAQVSHSRPLTYNTIRNIERRRSPSPERDNKIRKRSNTNVPISNFQKK